MQKQKSFLFFFSILFSILGFSQKNLYFGRNYTDTLPERYKTSIAVFRKTILESIPTMYRKDEYSRMNYRFSDQQGFAISDLISSGYVYSDWFELEEYVNEILFKVIPAELKNDTIIHAYLVKNGDFNAFMTSAGQMFINIGVFAHIYDETTLAAILAHELAHYYKYHSYQTFFNSEKSSLKLLYAKSKRNFSINQELEADSLAMIWLGNSNYNISGTLKAFQILKRLEQKEIRKLEDKWKLEETDHPMSEERLYKYNDFIEKRKNEKGENFLVDKEKFSLLKEEIKPEILKNLLNGFHYFSCIETAFKFHLFDPDNKVFVYYLMEAIRRMCYLNNELWEKNFITEKYYEDRIIENKKQKVKVNADIFEKFDLSLMALEPQEINKINARFYWEEKPPKFKTYEQAYEFFFRLGKLLRCNECIFSNALSHTKNKQHRDSLLREYLSLEDIKYRSFSEKILLDSAISFLPKRKLIVFNNFLCYVNQGSEKIPVRIQSDDDAKDITALFDSVSYKFPERTTAYMPSLKYKGLNDFLMFKELSVFSNVATVSKGEKAEIHILDPRYLDLFTRYNVNEIEFLNCSYREYRKSEKEIDAYDEVTNLNYQQIFSQTKRTRYFEVYISSVRAIEKGTMKIRYYSGERELNFKEQGLPQLISEIKYQIRQKDEFAKKTDIGYYSTKYIMFR